MTASFRVAPIDQLDIEHRLYFEIKPAFIEVLEMHPEPFENVWHFLRQARHYFPERVEATIQLLILVTGERAVAYRFLEAVVRDIVTEQLDYAGETGTPLSVWANEIQPGTWPAIKKTR